MDFQVHISDFWMGYIVGASVVCFVVPMAKASWQWFTKKPERGDYL